MSRGNAIGLLAVPKQEAFTCWMLRVNLIPKSRTTETAGPSGYGLAFQRCSRRTSEKAAAGLISKSNNAHAKSVNCRQPSLNMCPFIWQTWKMSSLKRMEIRLQRSGEAEWHQLAR